MLREILILISYLFPYPPPNSSPSMEALFDHEKLDVYKHSIEFVSWTNAILEKLPKTSSIHSQLDRASLSIPLNIAEGNGKWSRKDRCRFFDIAKGSALECAAALDSAVAREFLEKGRAYEGKLILSKVVRMLIGLIQANDQQRELQKGKMRVGEDGMSYEVGEKEKDKR